MKYYIIKTYIELIPTTEIGPDGMFIEKPIHKKALCDLEGTIIKDEIKTWIPDGLYRYQPSIQKIINS
jgi:hypothetical protein